MRAVRLESCCACVSILHLCHISVLHFVREMKGQMWPHGIIMSARYEPCQTDAANERFSQEDP